MIDLSKTRSGRKARLIVVLLAAGSTLPSLGCEQHHRLDAVDPAEDAAVADVSLDAALADSSQSIVNPQPTVTDGGLLPLPNAGPTFCTLDQDRDGFRVASAATSDKPEPACERTKPGDCNDSTPKIHPDGPELCNELDDDCDGQIDEGRTCTAEYQSLLQSHPPMETLATVSGEDGVVYLHRADMRAVMRLAADDSPSWTTMLETSTGAAQLAVDTTRQALYLAALLGEGKDQRTTVLRFDTTTGQLVWKRTLDVASTPTSIAIGPTGDIHVSGSETISLPKDTIWAMGLLARLTESGEIVRQESSSRIHVFGVAAAADGALAVVARVNEINLPTAQLGPCTIERLQPEDPFLIYVKPDGTCGWVQSGEQVGGSSSDPDFSHVAFLPDGAIVIAGAPFAKLRFAGSELDDPRSTAHIDAFGLGGDDEPLVVAVERSGALRWFHRVPNVGWDSLSALLVEATRVLVGLALHHYEVYSPGYASSTLYDIGVLMALDPRTGSEVWSRDFVRQEHGYNEITSLAQAADGSLRVVSGAELLRVQPPPER